MVVGKKWGLGEDLKEYEVRCWWFGSGAGVGPWEPVDQGGSGGRAVPSSWMRDEGWGMWKKGWGEMIYWEGGEEKYELR